MRKSILFAAICGLMSSVAFAESPTPGRASRILAISAALAP